MSKKRLSQAQEDAMNLRTQFANPTAPSGLRSLTGIQDDTGDQEIPVRWIADAVSTLIDESSHLGQPPLAQFVRSALPGAVSARI